MNRFGMHTGLTKKTKAQVPAAAEHCTAVVTMKYRQTYGQTNSEGEQI